MHDFTTVVISMLFYIYMSNDQHIEALRLQMVKWKK